MSWTTKNSISIANDDNANYNRRFVIITIHRYPLAFQITKTMAQLATTTSIIDQKRSSSNVNIIVPSWRQLPPEMDLFGQDSYLTFDVYTSGNTATKTIATHFIFHYCTTVHGYKRNVKEFGVISVRVRVPPPNHPASAAVVVRIVVTRIVVVKTRPVCRATRFGYSRPTVCSWC